MKKISFVFLLVCSLIVFNSCVSFQTPKAEHPEKWEDIENYIFENWSNYTDTMSSLPRPYSFALNPGTLYYWDLYFINEGLLMQGLHQQAKNNIDNFIYEIEKLGFIPNANDWGENRSQTPYFAMMVRSFYEKVTGKNKEWLLRAYQAVIKEYEFWTNTHENRIEDHSTPVPGLQRFSNHADSAYLVYFYDRVLTPRFKLNAEIPIQEKMIAASHRLSEAETMDFTPRFEGRAENFIAVDLNANLYEYEKNIGFFERELGISDGKKWETKAESRRQLIDKYLWNEERGLYLDYDFIHERHSKVAALTTFMPLYWSFATPEKAKRIIDNLVLFEYPGGVAVCEKTDAPYHYQWGSDAIWAPMQFLVMGALENYGSQKEMQRIATKWINTVTRNYIDPIPATYPPFKYGDGQRHPGYLYEKYTTDGFINDSEYPCSEMLGWTASTFLRSLSILRSSAKGTKKDQAE